MLAMPNGLQCRCGRQGCLDTVAGSEAILVAAREASLPVNDLKDLEALATKGNSQAIAILRNAGEALGLAVASIIQLNNPEFILFANVAGFDNGLFTVTTRQTIENNILPRFLASTRILFHHVQPSFLARGAACIAAHKFLFEQTGRQGNLVNKTDKIRDFLTDRLAGCG
jgi:predicted NBD/HSP70 family sugar kinase